MGALGYLFHTRIHPRSGRVCGGPGSSPTFAKLGLFSEGQGRKHGMKPSRQPHLVSPLFPRPGTAETHTAETSCEHFSYWLHVPHGGKPQPVFGVPLMMCVVGWSKAATENQGETPCNSLSPNSRRISRGGCPVLPGGVLAVVWAP